MNASSRLDLPDVHTSGVGRARRISSPLLGVATVVAIVAALAGWQTPLMLGLVGVGATLWRVTGVTGRIPRLRVVVIGALLTASVVTWSWMDWRLVTVGGICAALVLFPALQMVERRDDTDNRSHQRWRLIRGLVIGTTIVLTALAVLGTFERNQASFAIRYGQPVTVTVGPSCTELPFEGMPCVDATWTIDGTTYRGDLLIGPRELAANVTHAYAYPGDANSYSARSPSAAFDGMELVGFVPTWLAIVGLIGLLIGALPARLRNRIRLFGRVE